MALATRPKPKAQDRKRQAQHHKYTKHYTKHYWPYLPMLAVIAVGAAVNSFWSRYAADPTGAAAINYGRPATRIEAVTGSVNLSLSILVIVAAVAAGMLVFRYWYRLQRALNKGEAFVAKHPWLDLALLIIIVTGVVLSRPNGVTN